MNAVSFKVENNEDVMYEILSYLHAPTLVCMKAVNQNWKELCTDAIDRKLPMVKGKRTPKKEFQSNDELIDAVEKYVSHNSLDDAEELAKTYGYPIGQWDVSKVTDFSYIFDNEHTFNEKIGSWDVSNACTMKCMFRGAQKFNQELSLWNTSNVTDMRWMFAGARSFNRNLFDCDIFSVANCAGMFKNTKRVQNFGNLRK